MTWLIPPSERGGLDQLIARTGGKHLIDSQPSSGLHVEASLIVLRDTQRVAGVVSGPGVDRILEEPDRAVGEGEISTVGVEARRRRRVGAAVGLGRVGDFAERVQRENRP